MANGQWPTGERDQVLLYPQQQETLFVHFMEGGEAGEKNRSGFDGSFNRR